MWFAHSGYQHICRIRIARDDERWILILHALQRLSELVQIGLRRRCHGCGVGAMRESDAIQLHLATTGEGVASVHRFELAHTANISGGYRIRGDVFLAATEEELTHTLLFSLGDVVQRRG